MRLFRILIATALTFSAVLSAEECGPRVRRAYSKLTTDERETLKLAFEEAMKQGHHHRFVDVHQQKLNEYEAHGCMFIYWHRRFLWGYENMLRSLGDRFQCLTLPYWDYASASSNQLDPNVTCSTMATCNPILTDYGASDVVNTSSYYIGIEDAGGEELRADNCIVDKNQPATRSFCQNETAYLTNTCYGCIPRGNWFTAHITSDMTLASISNQIFAKDFVTLTQNLLLKLHPKIHANLNGALAGMGSPSDPVFYFHHATIDALFTIYEKCQAPTAFGSDSRLFPSTSTWGIWNRRVCGPYSFMLRSSAPKFTMSRNTMSMVYVNSNGTVLGDVGSSESPLAPFFKYTSRQYTWYYRYPSTDGISYDFTDTGFDQLNTKCASWIDGTKSGTAFLDEKKTRKHRNKHVKKQLDETQKLYRYTKRYVKNDAKAREYVEMMLCVHRNECMGGVFDYSEQFKQSFKVNYSPYCYDVLEDIAHGRKVIPVPGWAKAVSKTFGCHIKESRAYK